MLKIPLVFNQNFYRIKSSGIQSRQLRFFPGQWNSLLFNWDFTRFIKYHLVFKNQQILVDSKIRLFGKVKFWAYNHIAYKLKWCMY
jgi:hypothetical protein